MGNNIFLLFLIVGAVILGALVGYFVFLGIYQDQFAQQDRITLENFESATVLLYGTVVETSSTEIILEKDGVRFSLRPREDTIIMIPEQGESFVNLALARVPVMREGTIQEIPLQRPAEAVARYENGVFELLRLAVSATPDFVSQ